MLELSVDSTEAEKGSVMLVNERGELSILAYRGDESHGILTKRVKIGEGIAGKIAQEMKPTLVSNIEGDTRFKGKRRGGYKTNSFISCPIVGQRGLLGLININDKKDLNPFTEHELDLIRIIADYSAIALDHAYNMKQLRAKSRELDEIRGKLLDYEVSKAKFIANISHDLRTPINSIRGAVYYLKNAKDTTKEEQAEFLSIISNETSKIIFSLDSLISQINNGDKTGPARVRLVNISEVIREIAVLMSEKSRVSRMNLRLAPGLEDVALDIVGDKMKVRQFFINLLDVLGLHLKKMDTILFDISENDVVEVSIDIPREMPDKLLSYLSDKSSVLDYEIATLDYEISDPAIKLYLAKKVAKFHHWNIDARNIDDSCRILIRIPRSTKIKREAVICTIAEIFVDLLSEMLDIQTCSVMLYDDTSQDLTIKSARGLSDDIVRQTILKKGDKIAGQVVMRGEPLFVRDVETELPQGSRNNPRYNTHSFISLPLKIGGKTIGVINMSNKENGESFSEADFEIASLIGSRLSHFLEKYSSGDYDESSFKHFVSSFDSLLYIQGRHSEKREFRTDLMIKLVKELGLSQADKKTAIYVSAAYDIGLMLIDKYIVLNRKFSSEDLPGLKFRSVNTVSVLDCLELPHTIKDVISHHRERYGGTGYPDGLKGEEIPFLSRILSVADSFKAMISERTYGEKLTEKQALQEIRKGLGSLYDPVVVAALESILKPS